ncbi:MAG: hypothetical protein H0U62_13680 [Actinobacteria bacterium]|nr:hypothetical protein [Actinomycetota bacterium]
MPVLEDLQLKQNELIRKITSASMFVAPPAAPLPVTLTTGGVRAVQTITVTGTPTGGTFTLTFLGQTTAAIVFNATATVVQDALVALSNVNPGDVVCTGGPLPTTAVVATFGGQYSTVATMTATGSFTGGSTPGITVAATTPGTAIELAALPTGAGYVDLGLVTKDDGYSFGNEWETSEVTSHGIADPTRRDVLSATSTVGLTAQETKRQTLEMFHAVDLSGVVATASGEFAFSQPLAPVTRYYRTFLLARDGIGDSAVYMGMLYPRSMVSETGEQAGSEESEFAYPLTLTATPDSTVGYSVRFLFGGPGWRAQLTKMGF